EARLRAMLGRRNDGAHRKVWNVGQAHGVLHLVTPPCGVSSHVGHVRGVSPHVGQAHEVLHLLLWCLSMCWTCARVPPPAGYAHDGPGASSGNRSAAFLSESSVFFVVVSVSCPRGGDAPLYMHADGNRLVSQKEKTDDETPRNEDKPVNRRRIRRTSLAE